MEMIHQKRAQRNIEGAKEVLGRLKEMMEKKVEKPGVGVLLNKSRGMKVEEKIKGREIKDKEGKSGVDKKKVLEDILSIDVEPEFQEYITINEYDTLQNTLRDMKFNKGFRERRFRSEVKPSWNKPEFLNLISVADKKRHGEELPKELLTLREDINPKAKKPINLNSTFDNLSFP